jgi:hypothetical protein
MLFPNLQPDVLLLHVLQSAYLQAAAEYARSATKDKLPIKVNQSTSQPRPHALNMQTKRINRVGRNMNDQTAGRWARMIY